MLEDEISFNSQNPEIATVDSNGVITGISKGSTTVEVTCLLYTSPSPRD